MYYIELSYGCWLGYMTFLDQLGAEEWSYNPTLLTLININTKQMQINKKLHNLAFGYLFLFFFFFFFFFFKPIGNQSKMPLNTRLRAAHLHSIHVMLLDLGILQRLFDCHVGLLNCHTCPLRLLIHASCPP
jgi:hypothetical protein